MIRLRLYAIIFGALLITLMCFLHETPLRRESITGRVASGGKPAPGVSLFLVRYSPKYPAHPYSNSSEIKKVAVTGNDGVFRFTSPKPVSRAFGPDLPVLVVYSPNHALGILPLNDISLARLIRFDLEKAAPVSGMVRNRDGEPIKGATVRVFRVMRDSGAGMPWDARWPPESLKTKTDREGRFVLPNLPRESQVDMYAVAPGYGLAYQYNVTSGQAGVEIKLYPEGGIEGKVTYGHNGMPVKGVAVCIPGNHLPDEYQIARTDFRGRYRISHVSPGEYTVSVIPEPGFPKWTARDTSRIEVNAGKTTGEVNLRLIKGGVITGKTIDRESGKPAPGVTVSAGQSSRIPIRGISNSRGEYRLRVPPGSNVFVYTSAPPEKYIMAWRDTTLRIADGQTVRGIDFEFKKGITVTGKVLSPEDRPEAGVVITSDHDSGGNAWYGSVQSDSTGTFVLHNVAEDGTIRLIAEKKELSLIGRAAFRTGDKIVFRLSRYSGAEIQGRVLDEERRPVRDAHVRLNNNSAWTDMGGVFLFRNVKPEEQGAVTVEAYGYKSRSFSLPEWKGNVLRLDDTIILRTDRWIEGTVVDFGGKPLEGALVEVMTGCCREHVEARTDARGHFRLEGLMHLVEPTVSINHNPTGHRNFRYVSTNAAHRFVLEKKSPVIRRDDSRFDWKKAEAAWRSFEGSAAPPLQVSRWLNGDPVDLKLLRGKLVVLHFWTSDNPESVESLRLADTLHRRYGRSGVAIIAIHPYTADVERVRALFREMGISCRVAIDRQPARKGVLGRTFEEYKSGSYPFPDREAYSVLVDRTGRVNLSGLARDDHTLITPRFSEVDAQNDIESKVRRLYRTSE